MMKRFLVFASAGVCLLLSADAFAQGLTGSLIGTVKDSQGGAISGAVVRVGSPARIGGPTSVTTDEKGQWHFSALPPGSYVLDVTKTGFATLHEEDVPIGAGATISRTAVLQVPGVVESVVVEGAGSRIDARSPGFGTRFGADDLRTIPTRRASMFDAIRAAPGISATSPSSGTTTTISAFGSGTNENQFLIDGTNFTCPCNGIARSEPGVDFIQEVQVQSVGASAEFGNVQGAVINIVTRQGSERFLYDASYYAQPTNLTTQPVHFGKPETGYVRSRYRDFTTNLGGPAIRNRLWFFSGYQYLRDYDSQPGTDPTLPRTYEQNKIFAKLTWQLAPGWQLLQSLHNERWVNPEQPTIAKPFATTLRTHASVPAITFGDLTNTSSTNTVWDARVGRFVYTREDDPSSGDRTIAGRTDTGSGIASGAPLQFGSLTLIRTTAKATMTHYQAGVMGADHEWKIGVQWERGEHISPSVIPTGVRYIDINKAPSQSVSSAPSNSGGMFITSSGFASDALTMRRLTINAGLRFDHSRAISQNLHGVDLDGRETAEIIPGLGTMYTWNVVSPRLGMTARVTSDGRTILRASYGQFSQGVLTGELGIFHPAVTPTITRSYDPESGEYKTVASVVDPRINLQFDPHTRPPHTNEYSVGLDREVGRQTAVAIAYVGKNGANFIGWSDVTGQYHLEPRTVAGRDTEVWALEGATADRRFRLANQDSYSMTYNGVVMVVEKRRSHGWQAFGSYTFSRTAGLQPWTGTTTVAGAQVSTVAPPPAPLGVTFGRDPNDLINARGRLPNDRPHMFRAMGSVDVPRTGVVLAANLGYFSGKPWAATGLTSVRQNPQQQRILLEPRGTRHLSSQTLLDLRISRPVSFGGGRRIELTLDALNVLNNAAEEGLITDNLASANFGLPSAFIDPRRFMISVRMNLGR
jgi:hypothetical protein